MRCISTEAVNGNGLIYDVQTQIVASPDEDEDIESCSVLAECVARMVFLQNGKMVEPPPHIVEYVAARREEWCWDEGLPGVAKGPPPPCTSPASVTEPLHKPIVEPHASPASVTEPLASGLPQLSLCDVIEGLC